MPFLFWCAYNLLFGPKQFDTSLDFFSNNPWAGIWQYFQIFLICTIFDNFRSWSCSSKMFIFLSASSQHYYINLLQITAVDPELNTFIPIALLIRQPSYNSKHQQRSLLVSRLVKTNFEQLQLNNLCKWVLMHELLLRLYQVRLICF